MRAGIVGAGYIGRVHAIALRAIGVDVAAVAGRTLIVQHGDRTCHSWTLDSLESTAEGTRLHVREEPGFTIDPHDHSARYYQFPQVTAPGPHRFRLAQIVR